MSNAEAHEEGRKLLEWLKSMTDSMGRGGKQVAAETIGMSPNAFSKLIHQPDRTLDAKTIMTLQWLLSSKSENWQHLPLESEEVIGKYVFEHRQGGVISWRLAERSD